MRICIRFSLSQSAQIITLPDEVEVTKELLVTSIVETFDITEAEAKAGRLQLFDSDFSEYCDIKDFKSVVNGSKLQQGKSPPSKYAVVIVIRNPPFFFLFQNPM